MVASITFPGTSNQNLVVLDNEAFDEGRSIPDMDELIRQTAPFEEKYSPPLIPDELFQDYHDGTLTETTTVPNLVLIRGSQESFEGPTLSTHTGLIGSILTAYNTHQNLQLRPDDLWITLLAQFSAYVNGRAEELRPKIVNHEGQTQLEVRTVGSIYGVDFGAIHQQFLEQIGDNVKDAALKDWFLPGFSTSTRADDTTAAAMAMCSLQAYFSYQVSLLCGIPQITLLGSVDDWKALRQKVEKLLDFDDADKTLSEKWVPLLRAVLDEFVESAQNGSQTNLEFWDSIVSHKREADGCTTRNDLTGWISAFTIFNEKGELYASLDDESPWPQVPLDDIHHNVATCPVAIHDNGVDYNATLFVGQMAYDFDVDDASTDLLPPAVESIGTKDGKMRLVKPRNDWGLAISQGFQQVPYATYEDLENRGGPDGTVIRGMEECSVDKPLWDPFLMATADEQKQQRLAWIIPVVVAVGLAAAYLAYRAYRRYSQQPAEAEAIPQKEDPEKPELERRSLSNKEMNRQSSLASMGVPGPDTTESTSAPVAPGNE